MLAEPIIVSRRINSIITLRLYLWRSTTNCWQQNLFKYYSCCCYWPAFINTRPITKPIIIIILIINIIIAIVTNAKAFTWKILRLLLCWHSNIRVGVCTKRRVVFRVGRPAHVDTHTYTHTFRWSENTQSSVARPFAVTLFDLEHTWTKPQHATHTWTQNTRFATGINSKVALELWGKSHPFECETGKSSLST